MPRALRFEWELPDEAFGEDFDATIFVSTVYLFYRLWS